MERELWAVSCPLKAPSAPPTALPVFTLLSLLPEDQKITNGQNKRSDTSSGQKHPGPTQPQPPAGDTAFLHPPSRVTGAVGHCSPG